MTKARKRAIAPDRAHGDAGGAPVEADAGTIRQALADLEIDRPFYTCKVVGNRLEFSLYGGDVVFWPPEDVGADGRAPKRRKR